MAQHSGHEPVDSPNDRQVVKQSSPVPDADTLPSVTSTRPSFKERGILPPFWRDVTLISTLIGLALTALFYAGSLWTRVGYLEEEIRSLKEENKALQNESKRLAENVDTTQAIQKWIACRETEEVSGKSHEFIWLTMACVERTAPEQETTTPKHGKIPAP